jgi:curved DNA-binding protein
MNYKDYYEVLGLGRDATQDEIKRSYRKLARKYHPDVSEISDAEDCFKEVGEAYEVLKDPEKRAAYNQLGANWEAGQQFDAPPNWDAGFEFSGGQGDSAAFSDFFESLFGRGFSGGASAGGNFHSQGEDHHARVLIEIEDAYQGTSRNVTLQSPELDRQGHVVNKQRVLKVKIPKGIKQGQKIRLAGQGSAGHGDGAPGDLYLEIDFAPHSVFRVEGKDVYLDLPIAPWEAALGRKVKAPTPGGVVDLTIPISARSGQKLRLKGRGIPAKEPGDVYVTLRMVTPEPSGESEKELYQQMEREFEFNPRSELGV